MLTNNLYKDTGVVNSEGNTGTTTMIANSTKDLQSPMLADASGASTIDVVTDKTTTVPKKSSTSFGTSNFPAKLYFMLNEMEKDGQNDIASWLPNGRSFIVYKPKRFESEILPLYFQQTKFESFQRQLNLYNFCRITSGKEKGACFHKDFIRGQEQLVYGIKRMKIKGQQAKRHEKDSSAYLPEQETRGVAGKSSCSSDKDFSGQAVSALQVVGSSGLESIKSIPVAATLDWVQQAQQVRNQVLLDSFSGRNLGSALNLYSAQHNSRLFLPALPLLMNNANTNLHIASILRFNCLQAELNQERTKQFL